MVKYPNGKLTAKKGKYFIDRQELELTDTVEAIAVNPTIRLRGKQLLWQLKKDIVSGEQGLTIERYTKEKITARLQAQKGEALLKEEKIVVSGNVLLNSLEPAVQFASGEAVWDLKSGVITGKNSIQLTHNKDKVQFQANQGQFNLNTQQVNLTGAVKGTNEQPPATLSANQVDWNLQTEVLTAQGNVVYQQNNPRLKLNGDRAVGKLNQDQLVVSGTQGKQVNTEVIP
jgi:lipopolysaccharide assembly outer membrane protein LptD (OstA)